MRTSIRQWAATIIVAAFSLSGAAHAAATIADDLSGQYQAGSSSSSINSAISQASRTSSSCDSSACRPNPMLFGVPDTSDLGASSRLARMMNLPAGWPSYIRCSDYADQERLLILFATYDRSVKYVNAGDTYIGFNYDGTYRTGAYIKSCKYKSIQQLIYEGSAFY